MKKNLTYPFLGVFILLFLGACVKDTDFNNLDEIQLTPVVELDLIYFNLSAQDFFDENTSNPILTVRDTTAIRFLDDSQIQESLKRADFYFRFTNFIPREFIADFQFLSESNDTTYTTQTLVTQGSPQAPVVTEFEQVVEGDDVLLLTQASKVVVSVTIPSSDATLEGDLNLKSKTTYYLEL